MQPDLMLVKVDSNYCDYLRQYDAKVYYNAGKKDLRPFVGILFSVNNCYYFAPLSSPKPKHAHLKSNIDLIKINKGKLGVINLNNMIPVTLINIKKIDLNKVCFTKQEQQYLNLLNDQIYWLNRNKSQIYAKAVKLYTKYITNKINPVIKSRCCDFELLEEKCKEYHKYYRQNNNN